MVIEFGSEWRAVPLNEHCWQIQKRGVRKGEPCWNGVECYPTTVLGAVNELYERSARTLDKTVRVDTEDGPKALYDALAGIRDGIVESVREAVA